MPYKKVDITGEGTEVVDGGRGTPVDVVQEPTNELEKADTRFISSDKAPQKTVVDSDLQVLGKYYDKDGNEIGGGGSSVIEVETTINGISSDIVESLKAGDIVVENWDNVKTSYIVSTDDPDNTTKILTRYDETKITAVLYMNDEGTGWYFDNLYETPITDSQEVCSQLKYNTHGGTRNVIFPKYILPVAFITDSEKYYKCNYRTMKAIDEQSNQINLEFDIQNRVVANAITSNNTGKVISVSYCRVDSTQEQWISNADFASGGSNGLTNPVTEDLVIGHHALYNSYKLYFKHASDASPYLYIQGTRGEFSPTLTGPYILNSFNTAVSGAFRLWDSGNNMQFTPATTGTITKDQANEYVNLFKSGWLCIRNFENFRVSYYNPNETTLNYSYLTLVSIIDGGGLLTGTIIDYKINSDGDLDVSLSTY